MSGGRDSSPNTKAGEQLDPSLMVGQGYSRSILLQPPPQDQGSDLRERHLLPSVRAGFQGVSAGYASGGGYSSVARRTMTHTIRAAPMSEYFFVQRGQEMFLSFPIRSLVNKN